MLNGACFQLTADCVASTEEIKGRMVSDYLPGPGKLDSGILTEE
jgi:hypothetical protein